ncbi:malate synthase [Enhydrobacter aerosaccus]|uniref:Malate synthase n=1 Tax=Enhydrobacter aerosaccus TaxID=225324 RepID=A0A1T4MZG9_9HYPH|nr:malate synthase A [Enhydrobacter aerosaccus]SJZ72423.1 malate synthase [Enhydrobacter aerosaccus]
MAALDLPAGVTIDGQIKPGFERVLSREALEFLADLQRRFNARREELLAARVERQKRLDAGEKPDFLPETAQIRDSDWTVAPLPKDILDRRVEITGPVDRKMIINALNCGANVFMADFEDASTPTWTNMVEGQFNLMDAVRRQIDYVDPQSQKAYKLNDKTAVLFVRPRGWHLLERHMTVDGKPMSGSLFDFGLYFFHNAKEALARGTGPYFYLPKMESHLEARLWNDVFVHAQDTLGVPQKSIKATVLIETILATYEMNEILWELKDHSAGLNCGRWDYIFSFIKKFREQEWAVLPDRGQVTMTSHFLRCYSQLLIKTCHRREVHAMGGMAAQIPIKNDPAANEQAMERVRADKKREAGDGHDGTWVAHPGLVEIAKAEFDAIMKEANQIARKRQDVHVTAADLIKVPEGTKTEAGLRQNVAVGIGYVEAWLRGIGCVPLFNLMEDAATAEISRAQVWQWVRHNQTLNDGRPVTKELVRQIVREENDKVKAQIGEEAYAKARYEDAAQLMIDLVEQPQFYEFLTLPAYDRIIADETKAAA